MHASQQQPYIGVIDIGSNSVRLVVYDRLRRSPRPLFNEKWPCGLGHGIQATGRLNADAREMARTSIARYVHIARTMGLSSLHAIATAAIRDAEDGPDFIRELEREHEIRIRIISGEQEAHLAAQGVLASIHRPEGVAIDLGGGSLEAVELGERIGRQATFPLGTLRLIDACGQDSKKLSRHIRDHLETQAWLQSSRPALYVIGGGFRSIARVHMRQHAYPLRILHQYTLETELFMPWLRNLKKLSLREIQALKGLSARRAEGFLPSVCVLEEMLKMTLAKQLVISTAGIREGLLHDLLRPQERKRDGLSASLMNLSGKEVHDEAYTKALFDWQTPLFTREPPELARLRRCVCALSEIALPVNVDFRAEWAFEHLVVASLYGITHSDRITLALALYYRYRPTCKLETPLLRLVGEREHVWAQMAGQSAALASAISAGTAGLLPKESLRIKGDMAVLQPGENIAQILPATVEKKLEGLGEILSAYRKRFS